MTRSEIIFFRIRNEKYLRGKRTNMKKYTIVAGVNGAGKTTLYDAEQLQKTEYRINADDIKKTILCNVQKD